MSTHAARPAQTGQRRRAPRMDFAAVIRANIDRRPARTSVFADWAHI